MTTITTATSPITARFESPQALPQFRGTLLGTSGSESFGSEFHEDGFGSTTYGRLAFHRIESDKMSEPATLDRALEVRLGILCDKLRAKY